MTTAAFEYKCRRCGKVDRNPKTGEQNGMMVIAGAVNGRPDVMPGHPVNMVSFHTCPDKGVGVTDLIGYSIEE